MRTALSSGRMGSVCPHWGHPLTGTREGEACRPGPLFRPERAPCGTTDKLSRKHGAELCPGGHARRPGALGRPVGHRRAGRQPLGSFSLSQTCTSSASQRVTQAQMSSPSSSEARGHRQPRGLITKDLKDLSPASGRGVKRVGHGSADGLLRPAASALTLDPKPSWSLLSGEEP